MRKFLYTASILCLLASSASYASQQAGVGIESTVATGYGLYAVTMRASSEPGSISSFYLYEQTGTWPSRWREIDLEFTPGFTGVNRNVDPNHTHSLAIGNCYSPYTTDNLPVKEDCSMQYFLEGKAGSNLSFNTYNHRSIDGEPYVHGNDQVFMPSTNGDDVFKNYYTYYFYYTPNGIYWTTDLPATKLTIRPPTTLPTPAFVKKDVDIVSHNLTWNPAQNPAYQGFWYDSAPLTPKTHKGELTQTGTLMKLSMNIWDGTNTDGSHLQDWGGPIPPKAGASSSYLYVAYYPLQTPVREVGNDPTQLKYGNAAIYSDFTTEAGTFLINQQVTSFNTLWHVSNGTYLWPIGQLDERNLYCGKGSLTLKISDPYPTPRNNYDKLDNCEWLNEN